jgi:hypothetical protein
MALELVEFERLEVKLLPQVPVKLVDPKADWLENAVFAGGNKPELERDKPGIPDAEEFVEIFMEDAAPAPPAEKSSAGRIISVHKDETAIRSFLKFLSDGTFHDPVIIQYLLEKVMC